VRVTRTGGFMVKGVFYSAPSQLVGQRLRVHIHDDRIVCEAPRLRREGWLGATRVVAHPRRRKSDNRSVHVVDYHHVIHALRRKPGAFAGSVFRDSLFPRSEDAEAWTALSPEARTFGNAAALPEKEACRRMVGLLALAHDEACVREAPRLRREAELAALIAEDLAVRRLPEPRALAARLEPRRRQLPEDTPVMLADLASFDALLGAGA